MMCLALRFKACTVCKTVGARTTTLFWAQTKKCQLKVKHVGYVILLPPFSISLNHNDLFKQQHVGSYVDKMSKYSGVEASFTSM